jgi:hypothetical protein
VPVPSGARFALRRIVALPARQRLGRQDMTADVTFPRCQPDPLKIACRRAGAAIH